MINTQETGEKKEPRRRRYWIAGVLAAAVLALGLVLLAAYRGWVRLPDPIQAQIDILPDLRAESGSLGAEEEPVEPGSYRVVIDQEPTLSADGKSCAIHFENPSNNQYAARVSLYDGASGELLGASKRIDPGKSIETLSLDRAAEGGQTVQAVIELFEEKEPAGSLQFQLILRQGGEEG